MPLTGTWWQRPLWRAAGAWQGRRQVTMIVPVQPEPTPPHALPPRTGQTTRPHPHVIPLPGSGRLPAVDHSLQASAPGPPGELSALTASGSSSGAFGPASRLGMFLIERELARGGMGVVYVAVHEQLGRRVALKVMLGWGDPEEAERFRFEAQAAARLRHPDIVGIHEVGQVNGKWYLAMDLVEGPGSLQNLLERQGPLDPRRSARLIERVARAVHFAHTRFVLHRDLKPHNVLVDADGSPRLTDFGLAKDIGRAERGVTVTGQILGTPAFMSPEQAQGDPALVDRRSDVWGLGATLYACLVGHPPFRGKTALDLLRQVVEEEPPPPSAARPGLDRDLETIVLGCLRKDPAARYATAELLADDLARWSRGEPIAARRPGVRERLVRWTRRHARPLAAAVLVLALLGGVLAVSRVSAARERQREAQAAAAEEGRVRAQAILAAQETAQATLVKVGAGSSAGERLALALEALAAAQRWRDLSGDALAGEGVRAAQRRLAEEALAGRQFELASAAFEQAGDPEGAARAASERDAQAARADSVVRETLTLIRERGRFGALDVGRIARNISPRTLPLLLEPLSGASQLLERGESLGPELGTLTSAALRTLTLINDIDLLPHLGVLTRLLRVDGDSLRRVDALRVLVTIDTPPARRAVLEQLASSGDRIAAYQREEFDPSFLDRCEAEDPPALLLRARARLAVATRVQHLEHAVEDLSRALHAEPTLAEALRYRAETYEQLSDFAAAQADLDRLASLSPDDPALALNRARIAYARGDRQAALLAADRAVAAAPAGDPTPLMTRALMKRRHDLDGALADVVRACSLAPEDPRPHLLHGDILLRRGDAAAALTSLELALRLDASSGEAWATLALAHVALGKLTEAEQCIQRARERSGHGLALWLAQARFHMARGEFPPALRALDEGLGRLSDNVDLLALRSQVRARMGDLAGAEADLGEIIARSPSPVAFCERGILRRWLGDLKGAREDLDRAVELYPADPRSLAERSRVRLEQGDLTGALADAEQSLSSFPAQAQALNVRGRVRLARGERKAGAADLERALELAPSAANADELRALIRQAREGR